jgi:hypothetical protein
MYRDAFMDQEQGPDCKARQEIEKGGMDHPLAEARHFTPPGTVL